MGAFKLIDKLKQAQILFIGLLIVAINVVVNIVFKGANLEIFNAAFGSGISLLTWTCLLTVYLNSRRRNFIFTRTILLMLITSGAWFLGDAAYLFIISTNGDPFVSVDDIFYITATLLAILTVLTIPGSQAPSRRRNMVFIEISILVLSATIILSVLLLLPGNPDLSFDRLTMLMVFIYPVLDIILLWVIMIMFFTYPVRSSQKVLGIMLVATLFLLTSDAFYLINSLYSPFVEDYIIDLGYYFFYVLLLIAGLTGYNEIREQAIVSGSGKTQVAFRQSSWIVYVPGVFLITIIGLVMVFAINHSFILYHGLVVLIAFVIILFIIHQYFVITDNITLTKDMKLINTQLESKVELRTAELSNANTELLEEMTERRKAEEHLARINQELAQVNREKDKLFSIMAHDLRSPLGSMMKLSELLVENVHDFEEDEILEVSGTLFKTASNTFQLLNDLLAWSAVQMGRGERKKEFFNIADTVAENIAILTSEAGKKSILLSAEIENSIVAYADKFAIHTVLRNLLSNAIKFTHAKGTVTVDAVKREKHVLISVKDNGLGMPPDRQNKIFRIDAVSSSPGTEGEKGSGFGLLLCKDLVERNGGEIWLESEKDKGSTFNFTIPVNTDEQNAVSEPKKKIASHIDTKYVHAMKLAFTNFIGEFTVESLQQELKNIWQNENYKRDYSVLVDIRKANFAIEIKELGEVLQIFAEMPGNQNERKFALLTTTPQQVAFSTMFSQSIKKNYPFNIEIFSTYEACLKWIES